MCNNKGTVWELYMVVYIPGILFYTINEVELTRMNIIGKR